MMTATLIEAASAAGLLDSDLLKIARTDVPPDQAIRELREKCPGAFKPIDARTMSNAEYKVHVRKICRDDVIARYRRRDEDDWRRIQAKHEEQKS